MSENVHLFIEMPFLESPRPNREEFRIRNRLIEELCNRNFGRLIGTMSGSGQLNIDYMVQDETEARRLLAEVVDEIEPELNYTVRRLFS